MAFMATDARIYERRYLVAIWAGIFTILFAVFWLHIEATVVDHAIGIGLLAIAGGLIGYGMQPGKATPLFVALVAVPVAFLLIEDMAFVLAKYKRVQITEPIFFLLVAASAVIGAIAIAFQSTWSGAARVGVALVYLVGSAVLLTIAGGVYSCRFTGCFISH